MILVADIGGTNTRAALATPEAPTPQAAMRFRNAEHGGLAEVLEAYLAAQGRPALSAVCVAVAGPVRHGAGRLTNLPWQIDAATLRAATGAATAVVINDLEAQGYAIGDVEVRHLRGAAPEPGAPQLVVGIGTGFNACVVHHPPGGGRFVAISECGHMSLPVADAAGLGFAEALTARHGFASIEEALAGRGLVAVNAHVAGAAARASSHDLLEALAGPAATEADRASAALYGRILGTVLGDLALVHLPRGGIYLIGGLARAVAPHFEDYGVAEAFAAKGRFAPLMAEFGLHLVEDDNAALIGCAEVARVALEAAG